MVQRCNIIIYLLITHTRNVLIRGFLAIPDRMNKWKARAEAVSFVRSKANNKKTRRQATSLSLNDSVLKERDSSLPSFIVYYNDVYKVELPANHRFPMEKYRLVREMVESNVSSLNKSKRKKVNCEFRVSPLATAVDLVTTHCPQYVENFLNGHQTPTETRNVGFPWSPSGVERALSSVGGTVAAASFVCESSRESRGPVWASHVAGGTHHAFYNRGEGFCVFNDIAVAANVILKRYPHVVKRVLIIDLDVHQGNGTARIFRGRKEVFTFSMHCAGNYFSKKETSDWDVELPVGCQDGLYLSQLTHCLKVFEDHKDDFDFIFYQAGVDVIKHDRLGLMNISKEGIEKRNNLMYEFAQRTGKGMVITMGGGYPRGHWDPIVKAHADVYFGAYQFLAQQ